MNTQSPVTGEFCPHVAIINGAIKTTSLKIAEHFNKRHDNVIQAITKLECSPEFNALNFKVVEYEDAKGEKRPAYEITRDGFMFLAMGFTGKAAAQWKEAYINAFNAMERELLQVHPKPAINNLRTRLLISIENGQVASSMVVEEDACAVSPHNAVQLRTFIGECVPFELVPVVFESASKRLIAHCQVSADLEMPQPARQGSATSINASAKLRTQDTGEQVASRVVKTLTASASLTAQFVEDWKSANTTVINAPFVPCLGTQALRLFHVWAQNKGIVVRQGNNHIMSDLYQHHGFYKSRVRVSAKAKVNPRTVLMIDGITLPAGITAIDWIADCIARMEAALNP